MQSLEIKQAPVEEAVKVNATITEFDAPYSKEYFEERYAGKKTLILLAYREWEAAGYIIGYDKYEDGSFYCWMAWVDPKFRKRGILKKLMEHHNTRAKTNGYNKVRIKTKNDRREMLSFLVKSGYNFTEVIPYDTVEANRILFFLRNTPGVSLRDVVASRIFFRNMKIFTWERRYGIQKTVTLHLPL